MTISRPFRFGVVGDGASSHVEWIAKARKTEELGYAILQLPDHLVTEFSPSVALMAAADATSTLRVGSFVFDNDFRHPVVLAKDIATLDVLSGGRFEMGIGGGWNRDEYERAGIPFDSAGTRIERLEESLQVIKGLFADEPVTFEGKHYRITDLNGLPKPVQKPHPPLFIGGGGKRVLALAAREATIIGVHYRANADGTVNWEERSSASLARKMQWIREIAGERFSELEFNLLIARVTVTDQRQQAIEQFIHERNWKVTVEQVLDSPYLFFGTVEQIAEKVQWLRERYLVSYITIEEEDQVAFAPIVARLAGI